MWLVCQMSVDPTPPGISPYTFTHFYQLLLSSLGGISFYILK